MTEQEFLNVIDRYVELTQKKCDLEAALRFSTSRIQTTTNSTTISDLQTEQVQGQEILREIDGEIAKVHARYLEGIETMDSRTLKAAMIKVSIKTEEQVRRLDEMQKQEESLARLYIQAEETGNIVEENLCYDQKMDIIKRRTRLKATAGFYNSFAQELNYWSKQKMKQPEQIQPRQL